MNPIWFKDNEGNLHYFRMIPHDPEAALKKFTDLYDAVRTFPIYMLTIPATEAIDKLCLLVDIAMLHIGPEVGKMTLAEIREWYLGRVKGLAYFIEHREEILRSQVPAPPEGGAIVLG